MLTLMKKKMMVTVRGAWDTSLQIVLDAAHAVGDVLDLSSIIRLVPEGVNYATFFRNYVDFCMGNNSSKLYRVVAIEAIPQGVELRVRAV